MNAVIRLGEIVIEKFGEAQGETVFIGWTNRSSSEDRVVTSF